MFPFHLQTLLLDRVLLFVPRAVMEEGREGRKGGEGGREVNQCGIY